MTTLANQIRDFVYSNLNVISEGGDEFAILCPFHSNTESPSFYVNKSNGLWHCFNESCAEKGRFSDLVQRITGKRVYEIEAYEHEEIVSLIIEDDEPEESFDEAMDRITIDYRDPEQTKNLSYLVDRGFELSVLEHFEVGYSKAQDRIVIPLRDENFKVRGFIGRALGDATPKYKYTTGFPRKDNLLNLCHAKEHTSVIVVEGSLDHIKVHQAGFPNVVSTMGSNVSDAQIALLNKYFSTIIVFADNDDAGEKMRDRVAESLARNDLFVVQYKDGQPKDPGDMHENDIRENIQNRQNILDYYFNKL